MVDIEPTLLYWVLGPWTGFFLGILHTIMPCEDKAIFCFYAFGVSRDWKQSLKILTFYGLGLFLMNLIIGSILSYIASNVGNFLLNIVDRRIFNVVSSASLIIGGFIMLFQIFKNRYWPHTDQLQEIGENIHMLKARKRTSFLLGLLAGIPPCIFEITVYIQAMYFSATSSWGNGVWTVFFFGLGTWMGLVPLAIVGTMSGKLSKLLKEGTIRKIRERLSKVNKAKNNSQNSAQTNQEVVEPKSNELSKTTFSKIELFSGLLLITLGVVLLILAIFEIDLFIIIPPDVPPLTSN